MCSKLSNFQTQIFIWVSKTLYFTFKRNQIHAMAKKVTIDLRYWSHIDIIIIEIHYCWLWVYASNLFISRSKPWWIQPYYWFHLGSTKPIWGYGMLILAVNVQTVETNRLPWTFSYPNLYVNSKLQIKNMYKNDKWINKKLQQIIRWFM